MGGNFQQTGCNIKNDDNQDEKNKVESTVNFYLILKIFLKEMKSYFFFKKNIKRTIKKLANKKLKFFSKKEFWD